MFNDPLFNEEVKLKVAEREREAETFRQHQELGYGHRKGSPWLILFFTLVALILILVIL